ncbi:hypothetical protein [Cronobacter malonaticus]|uniref:hypothetical protein n=1 Tax=Cronobacter malonaticus TaxID=413503 RepID=UPI000CFBECCD|nr:hypothetical protein [Cronobacter malonaticus]NCH51568.1 hypothetical protein [Cronobacter malonaticus]
MAYKYKATMYYSDEETEAFLRDNAVKSNGKKSASHYLYSLVTKERKNLLANNDIKNKAVPVQLFPEYVNSREFSVTGSVDFIGLPEVYFPNKRESSLIRQNHKSLMETIDDKILEDVANHFSNHNHDVNEKSFRIVLKTYVACYYCNTSTATGLYSGTFTAMCRMITVSRSEWDKCGGVLDFENLRYIKYEAIAKAERRIPRGLCKVAESSRTDPTGAFFIPVLTLPKNFPGDKLPRSVIIKGVDISFSKERLKFKTMNESQKKRHLMKPQYR